MQVFWWKNSRALMMVLRCCLAAHEQKTIIKINRDTRNPPQPIRPQTSSLFPGIPNKHCPLLGRNIWSINSLWKAVFTKCLRVTWGVHVQTIWCAVTMEKWLQWENVPKLFLVDSLNTILRQLCSFVWIKINITFIDQTFLSPVSKSEDIWWTGGELQSPVNSL